MFTPDTMIQINEQRMADLRSSARRQRPSPARRHTARRPARIKLFRRVPAAGVSA